MNEMRTVTIVDNGLTVTITRDAKCWITLDELLPVIEDAIVALGYRIPDGSKLAIEDISLGFGEK